MIETGVVQGGRQRPYRILGAAAAAVPYLLLVIWELVRAPVTEEQFFDWPGADLLIGGLLVTPLLLLAGIVLTIMRRTRRFGVGLLVGTAVSASLGLVLAMEVLPSIPALRH